MNGYQASVESSDVENIAETGNEALDPGGNTTTTYYTYQNSVELLYFTIKRWVLLSQAKEFEIDCTHYKRGWRKNNRGSVQESFILDRNNGNIIVNWQSVLEDMVSQKVLEKPEAIFSANNDRNLFDSTRWCLDIFGQWVYKIKYINFGMFYMRFLLPGCSAEGLKIYVQQICNKAISQNKWPTEIYEYLSIV